MFGHPGCDRAKLFDIEAQVWVWRQKILKLLVAGREGPRHFVAAGCEGTSVLPRPVEDRLVVRVFDVTVREGEQRLEVDLELAAEDERCLGEFMAGAETC